jgi:putative transposase
MGMKRRIFFKIFELYKFILYNTDMNYKTNNNIAYSCKYHVVWCPKYRRKVLIGGIDTRLKELIEEVCQEIHVAIIEMEIMPDHVHLLLEVDPQFGIHKAIKTIKGRTSRILRQEFPYLKTKLPTLWTNSYFVSTVGGAPLEIIKQYIEGQKRSQRSEIQ